MTSMCAPPGHAINLLLRLIVAWQGNRSLGGCVQNLQTLFAAMHQDPVHEEL